MARTGIVIVLVALFLVPVAGEAGKKRDVIVVRDYTSSAWDGVIARTVEDFNAVMPRRGPRLRYVRHDEMACDALPAPKPRDTFLAFCSVPFFDRPGHEFTALPYRKGVVAFADRHAYLRHNLICHELMHLLTGIHDNTFALPDQSCVWGSLSVPGPFDMDLLRKAYAKKTRR